MKKSKGGTGTSGKGAAIQWIREHANYPYDWCLIWPFALVRGYGQLGYLGKKLYAHRFMCELANGAAPSPLHEAAHSCGRGDDACINPRHLSWKTASGNQIDKRAHGTAYRAGKQWKLTPSQVLEIRRLKDEKTQDDLAKMFGVGRQNIGAILTGRSWQDLK